MGQQVKDSYGPMIFNTNAQLDGVNFLMAKFKNSINIIHLKISLKQLANRASRQQTYINF